MLKYVTRGYLFFVVALFVLLLPIAAQERISSLPIRASGEIINDAFYEEYTFELEESRIISAVMVPTGESGLDTRLLLLDGNNVILEENDDIPGGEVADGSRIDFSLSAGVYTIVATRYDEFDATEGSYDLTVTVQPEPTLPTLDVSDEVLASLGYPEVTPRERADWSIFAYYGADNDLEEAIINDANEFQRASVTDDSVRVLVLLDRYPDSETDEGDWTGTRLFEVTGGSMADVIDSEPLIDFGEVDMGDPQILGAFLTWGIRTFPADNYALSFGSHGAGWAGVTADYSNGDSTLTMNDLRRVLDAVATNTDFERFGLLINDACLMASIEYYDVMQPYVDLSVGSAELVTNPGLDMTRLTESLQMDVELPQLGRELVDQYINFDAVAGNESRAQDFTYAVTDLREFDNINAALNGFAQIINTNPQQYIPTLTQARANTYTYNRLAGNDQIDLGNFMEQVILVSTDTEVLIPAAQNVIDELANARIYGNAGEKAIEETSYYNIFFPTSRNLLEQYYPQSGLVAWEQMLNNYFAYSEFDTWAPEDDGVPFHSPEEPEINISRVIEPDDTVSFNLPVSVDIEVEATNVSRGIFYVERVMDDETAVRLLASPILRDVPVIDRQEPLRDQNVWRSGVDQRTVTWNAAAYTVNDGENTNTEFLQRAFDDSGTYFLEGQYRGGPDEEWVEVRVSFNPDERANREFDLLSTTFISVNRQSGTFGIFEPEIGGELQVYQTVVETSGRDDEREIERIPGNTYTITEQGLGALLEPVESDEYLLRVRVETFGQDPQESEVTVNVDNTDINPDVRGQNLIAQYGFTAGVPVWWTNDLAVDATTIGVSIGEDTPRVGNPFAASSSIDIYPYEGVRDVAIALDRFLNRVERPDDDVELTPAEPVDGREVYEYEFTDGSRAVRGFVTYDEANDRTLIFNAENRDSDSENVDLLFEALRDSVRFFDIQAGDDEWRNVDLSIEQESAIPVDWVLDDSDATWRTYHDPEDVNTRVSFATGDEAMRDRLMQAGSDERTYVGEQHTWSSSQYSINHDDELYVGRIYSTPQNGQWYFVRVEAPDVDAEDIYEDVFHPIVDSVIIQDIYIGYDWRETLGIRVEVPNRILDAEPYIPWRLFGSSGADLFRYSSGGSKELEVYLVDDVEFGNVMGWFANRWREEGTPYNLTNANFVEIGGQRALEFTVDLEIGGEIWEGRYFAVYSDADAKLYIIGGRSVEPIDREYNHLRDTVQFQFGNYDFYASILERPLYDPQYALDVDVWAVSEPLDLSRNYRPNVDEIRFSRQGASMRVYVIKGATDDLLAEFARLPFPEPTDTMDMMIDGRPALDIRYVRDGETTACFAAVADAERSRVVVAGATFDNAAMNCEIMRESLTIFPLE